MGDVLRALSRGFIELVSHLFISSKGNFEDAKLLFSYRYCSLLITSGFYFVNGPIDLLPYKIVAVLGLLVIARLLTGMYLTYSTNKQVLRSIILLETGVITLLLIPTGGLESPFIWYALNPVLVGAWYLSPLFCWLNLCFYMITSILISSIVFNQGEKVTILIEHSYLVLVFVLITLLVQLLAKSVQDLHLANLKQQESLDQIMSLYKIIEVFTKDDDITAFFQAITHYLSKLTQTEIAFFCQADKNKRIHQIYTNVPIGQSRQIELINQLSERIESLESKDNHLDFKIIKGDFYGVPVKTANKLYGILGVFFDEKAIKGLEKFEPQKLRFLSDLSSMILDRFSREESNDRLIMLEERNRIANEIHDSVSQRLFSINFCVHNLKRNWPSLGFTEIASELELIGNVSRAAMSELRESIYGWSTQRTQKNSFFSNIKGYLQDVAHLNNININKELKGVEEILSHNTKKSIYRVICEAVGNSIKHGACKNIEVRLEITSQHATLLIRDDGKGFETSKKENEYRGLGLNNIRNTIQSMGGIYLIESTRGKGTKIKVEIPMQYAGFVDQGGIA